MVVIGNGRRYHFHNLCRYSVVFFVVFMMVPHEGYPSQTIVEGPSDTSVNLHDASVTLNCIVANMSGDLFWVFERKIIPVSSTDRTLPAFPRYSIVGDPSLGQYNLQISDVSLDDDGSYECQVTPSTTSLQPLRSQPARLTVRRPPMSVSILEGSQKIVDVSIATNVSCIASGANPAATITWSKDGDPIGGSTTVSTTPSSDPSNKLWDTKSTLIVTPALGDHGSTLECQASNAATVDEPMVERLILDVQYPPVVLVESSPVELQDRFPALFQCVVDANPKGVFYQWSKNGEPIHGDKKQIELTLEKSDNQAVITCAASNAIGTSQGSLTLDVKYGPRFVDIPGETSVDEGELAQLECSADGNPSATIKWTRMGSRATLSTMQRLQFDSVQKSDVGIYVCEASVEGFPPIASYGRVDINAIPVLQYNSKELARPGSTARLECWSESKPEPEDVIWSINGVELDEDGSDRFSVTHGKDERGYIGVLTIRKVKPSDYTEYNCTMINAMGSSEAIIVLEQQGLDFFFYIIIFVVSLALLIFILSILFMVYCKRKLRQRSSASSSSSDEEKQTKVEIIRKLSDIHLSDDERRKLARMGSKHSSRETPPPPRYAEPVDYIPRRRDSWDDPTYRPLTIGSPTPPPYRDDEDDRDDVDHRFSYRSSHEYMEAEDGHYRDGIGPGTSNRDVQYESTFSGRRPPEKDAYSNHSQYSDNQGFGYFEEPRKISISGRRNDPGESLVHRDDVSRMSNMSMNSRNKLATNV